MGVSAHSAHAREPSLALAVAQLRGAPGQAAVSLAAIVASFSLMAAMAIMVASFRQSVDAWLDAVLPADLYFRSTHAGDTAYLEPGVEERVRALPEVERVDFLRSARVLLDPARPALSLIARDRAEGAFPVVGERYVRKPGDPPLVWVSEAALDLYGFEPGQGDRGAARGKKAALRGRRRRARLRAPARRAHHRARRLRRAHRRSAGERRRGVARGRASRRPPRSRRSARCPGARSSTSPCRPRSARLRSQIFDRSFAVTYAMEAVAVLVGLFGLSSSLGAIVLARRREFGVLRHLGLTRGDIRAMLAAEGGLLALLGARGRSRRGRRHQPDPRLCGQPPIVQLGHGASPALCAPPRAHLDPRRRSPSSRRSFRGRKPRG